MSGELPKWIDPSAWMEETCCKELSKIKHAIYAEEPGELEFARLLSPAALPFLEQMAQRAQAITRRHFGRTMALYAPLYLSNYCNGGCSYCGFAADRETKRMVLSMEELHVELAAFQQKGIQEIVMLTGERVPEADLPYLTKAIEVAAHYLPLINVEVFPMDTEEYRQLARAGCHGVTLYQETYDKSRYAEVHRWGDKSHFVNRIEAAERALRGGMRTLGIGALLGLGNPWFDMMSVYRHAKYLRKTFWQAGVSVSFPRIRPQLGGFASTHPLSDAQLVQFICAFRICMPDIPLVLSTRETVAMRDGLAGVGISKMSVESKTSVGGYTKQSSETSEQFSVNDDRNVAMFCASMRSKGLEPVFKNWDSAYSEPTHYVTHA